MLPALLRLLHVGVKGEQVAMGSGLRTSEMVLKKEEPPQLPTPSPEEVVGMM